MEKNRCKHMESTTQPACTCSKTTTETAEQCVRSTKKNNKNNTGTMSMTLFWCLYCSLWIDFTHCSVVSIADYKQLIARWEAITMITITLWQNADKFTVILTSLMSRKWSMSLKWICLSLKRNKNVDVICSALSLICKETLLVLL